MVSHEDKVKRLLDGDIDEAEIADFVAECLRKDLHCIVVCGVFSPVSSAQEERAAQLIHNELSRRTERRWQARRR